MINIIILKNISKIYANSHKRALDNINLEIREGEFFSFVGSSGSGKSTILKIITKIENPTTGEIEAPNNLGMVFQLGALFPWLTARDNVMFPLKMVGVPDQKAIETARKYLELVNLSGFENKYPRELSGGQRQRVGIARALVTDPKVLILDEPFSALDINATKELHADLLKIWKQTSKTIVLVSHLLEEAVFLSDRIGVIKEGKLVKIVDIDLKRPRDKRSSDFDHRLKELQLAI